MWVGWVALTAIWLLVGTMVPVVSAHGDGPEFRHLTVASGTLNATESRDFALASDEGPFLEGWVFIVYGAVEGDAPVVFNLTHDEGLSGQWVWTPGAFHQNTTRLKHSGEHHLTLWNPSANATTRYTFYYDQSCSCAAKSIPLPGGFVLFNYDFAAGRDASVAFPMVPGWSINGAIATLDEDGSLWPDDFTILTEENASGRGWLNLTFHTPREDRYYVFIKAVEGASPEDPIDLTPLVVVDAALAPSPGAVVAALSAAAVVLTLGRYRSEDRRRDY